MTDPYDCTSYLAGVPYLPGLGPIHPGEDPADCWRDLLKINGTGAFLPYDKDRVWGGRKADRVLAEAISELRGAVLIPVLHQRGHGRLEVFCCGDRRAGMSVGADAAAKLAADHGVAAARLKWYSTEPDDLADHVVRIQLKTFSSAAEAPVAAGEAIPLTEQSPGVQRTFDDFADAAGEGFPFLSKALRNGVDHGPILTVRDRDRIVGAIGPMRLQADSQGRARLMGQYFAVLSAHRGFGLGRGLWRAAMRWGRARGAVYQLLQTEYGGPSDRLCRSEGLTSLGYVNSLKVPL